MKTTDSELVKLLERAVNTTRLDEQSMVRLARLKEEVRELQEHLEDGGTSRCPSGPLSELYSAMVNRNIKMLFNGPVCAVITKNGVEICEGVYTLNLKEDNGN